MRLPLHFLAAKQRQTVYSGRPGNAISGPDRVTKCDVNLVSITAGPNKTTTGKTIPDRAVAGQEAS